MASSGYVQGAQGQVFLDIQAVLALPEGLQESCCSQVEDSTAALGQTLRTGGMASRDCA